MAAKAAETETKKGRTFKQKLLWGGAKIGTAYLAANTALSAGQYAVSNPDTAGNAAGDIVGGGITNSLKLIGKSGSWIGHQWEEAGKQQANASTAPSAKPSAKPSSKPSNPPANASTPPSAVAPVGSDITFYGEPTASVAAMDEMLRRRKSPLAGTTFAQALYDGAKKNRVDPAFALGMMGQENAFLTASNGSYLKSDNIFSLQYYVGNVHTAPSGKRIELGPGPAGLHGYIPMDYRPLRDGGSNGAPLTGTVIEANVADWLHNAVSTSYPLGQAGTISFEDFVFVYAPDNRFPPTVKNGQYISTYDAYLNFYTPPADPTANDPVAYARNVRLLVDEVRSIQAELGNLQVTAQQRYETANVSPIGTLEPIADLTTDNERPWYYTNAAAQTLRNVLADGPRGAALAGYHKAGDINAHHINPERAMNIPARYRDLSTYEGMLFRYGLKDSNDPTPFNTVAEQIQDHDQKIAAFNERNGANRATEPPNTSARSRENGRRTASKQQNGRDM